MVINLVCSQLSQVSPFYVDKIVQNYTRFQRGKKFWNEIPKLNIFQAIFMIAIDANSELCDVD